MNMNILKYKYLFFATTIGVILVIIGGIIYCYVEVYKVSNTKCDFRDYKLKFGKNYGGDDAQRFKNFKESLKEIERLNAMESRKVYGLTKFADMSKSEFAQQIFLQPDQTGCSYSSRVCVPDFNSTHHHTLTHTIQSDNVTVPKSFDWRSKGVISPVLDQKRCKACWAFGIADVMGVMLAIHKNETTSEQLSIQEVMDCTCRPHACDGANLAETLDYICNKYNLGFGLLSENDYPLTLKVENCKVGKKVGRCEHDYTGGTKLEMFKILCNTADDVIVDIISTHGPVLAVVDADPWQFYEGGIIQWSCPTKGSMGHVVQIVGYNRTGDVPYYIVKNSWGTDFGIAGYLYIGMIGNVCGINSYITYLDIVQQ